MDPFVSLQEIPEKELVPGFYGRLIHTALLTVGHFRIEQGSSLPEHQHLHEQITNVLSGEFEMTVAGKTRICRAGESVVIPSHTPHSGRALTDCRIIDVFHPAREDYK